jgi:hypothetical protein
MDYPAMYDANLALLKAALNHEKVDRVPVVSMAQTWASVTPAPRRRRP